MILKDAPMKFKSYLIELKLLILLAFLQIVFNKFKSYLIELKLYAVP